MQKGRITIKQETHSGDIRVERRLHGLHSKAKIRLVDESLSRSGKYHSSSPGRQSLLPDRFKPFHLNLVTNRRTFYSCEHRNMAEDYRTLAEDSGPVMCSSWEGAGLCSPAKRHSVARLRSR